MEEYEEKLKATRKAEETKIFDSYKSSNVRTSASGTKYNGAISSIHFAKVNTHSFKHNSREEEKQADTIFQEYTEQNEYNKSADEAKEIFDKLYKQTKKIRDSKSLRIADKKNCLWEAVINLKSSHTLADIKKLSLEIEKLTGFTAIQMAVHKDEGQEREGKLQRKNHHAHINFFTLDTKTGQQLYRREFMNRTKLRELQDVTAKVLDMERGQENSPTKRLEHKAYKVAAKEKERLQRANFALKQENLRARIKLKEKGATRAEYAELEQKHKTLKLELEQKGKDKEKTKQNKIKKYLLKELEKSKKYDEYTEIKIILNSRKNLEYLEEKSKNQNEDLKNEIQTNKKRLDLTIKKIKSKFFGFVKQAKEVIDEEKNKLNDEDLIKYYDEEKINKFKVAGTKYMKVVLEVEKFEKEELSKNSEIEMKLKPKSKLKKQIEELKKEQENLKANIKQKDNKNKEQEKIIISQKSQQQQKQQKQQVKYENNSNDYER